MAQPAPDDKSFQFDRFESLSDDQRVPAAKSYFAEHFPPGGNIQSTLDAMKQAGATCKDARNGGALFFVCKYKITGDFWPDLFFGKAIWYVNIHPDKNDSSKFVEILVHRETDGF
jgi:hypothetical protein